MGIHLDKARYGYSLVFDTYVFGCTHDGYGAFRLGMLWTLGTILL